MRYIFDTNIYNYILDEKIDCGAIKAYGNLYTTNVQISELKNCENKERQIELLKILNDLNPLQLNLESGIWIDELYWDDNQPWIDTISETCSDLKGNSTNKAKWRDALIGDVTKANDLILITNDKDFHKRAVKNGIKSLSFRDFFMSLTKI